MPRSLLLGGLLYGLLVIGLATLNGGLLVLAIPLVVYLMAGLRYQPDDVQLKATRTLATDRTSVGQPVEVVLTVTNQGTRLEQVRLRDLSPQALEVTDGATSVITTLEPSGHVELRYTLTGRRGLHQFGGVEVVATDQLGLFRTRIVVPAPDQIFILPDIMRLRRIEIRPRRTGVFAGSIPVRLGGPGIEFFGLREYRPGDPQRWINPRASARHDQRLFVNEFEQERVADIGLILDGRQRVNVRSPDGSLFEHSVEAAAALADALLRSGNRVGLAIYSNAIDWTFPGYGTIQRERILRALARAQPGDRPIFEGLDLLPPQLFPARSQLILISPCLPEDLPALTRMRAQGHQVLVISPNPIRYERALLPPGQQSDLAARIAAVERDLLLHRLRQTGMHVVDWPLETPFYQVAAQALSARWAVRTYDRMP